MDCITHAEKIARLTQSPEIQLAQAKVDGIIYKLINDIPPSSTSDVVKRGLCQVFSPVATQVHAAIQMYSRLQVANGTLQEYIQRFTDLVIHATGAEPTLVTCQVTIILFVRQFFQ